MNLVNKTFLNISGYLQGRNNKKIFDRQGSHNQHGYPGVTWFPVLTKYIANQKRLAWTIFSRY